MSLISSNMWRPLVLLVAVTTVLVAPSVSVATSSAPPPSGQAFIVQGVPGAAVNVRVDGRLVRRAMPAKAVVGPMALSPGRHNIVFRTPDWTVRASFNASKPSVDIVVHWPADATNEPKVTVFTNEVGPVAPDKGRLTVAHTAVVPPADIRVSGKVLFANVANGEFVTAEVPADTYSVDIVPTGGSSPLLGPVDLKVESGVLTRVFAIGAPKKGSMDAVVQVLPLPEGGSVSPGSVNAGSAGLVAAPVGTTGGADQPGHGSQAVLALGALAALVVGSALARRRHAKG